MDPPISKLEVAPGATSCQSATYIGEISIGSGTVVHPKAKIIAEAGPIIIGQGNLIEELATIANRATDGTKRTLVIGDNNVFEVGSLCEAVGVGNNNVFEVKSHVGPQVEVTRGCVIGVKCSLTIPQKLEEKTVVYGNSGNQRVLGEAPGPPNQQMDFLRRILPNYHNIIKAKKKPA